MRPGECVIRSCPALSRLSGRFFFARLSIVAHAAAVCAVVSHRLILGPLDAGAARHMVFANERFGSHCAKQGRINAALTRLKRLLAGEATTRQAVASL